MNKQILRSSQIIFLVLKLPKLVLKNWIDSLQNFAITELLLEQNNHTVLYSFVQQQPTECQLHSRHSYECPKFIFQTVLYSSVQIYKRLFSDEAQIKHS